MTPPQPATTESAIQPLRDADVPDALAGGVFRYSPGYAVIAAALMASGGVALIGVGRVQDNALATYLGALLLLCLWIYQTVMLARFRPTNWLVRITERGLYIKFRSYLNHHFPDTDPTVVHIPFRAMRLTRVVRESQTLPSADHRGSMIRRRVVVEIELREDAPAISAALSAERSAEAPKVRRWYGSSASKYKHYPVRMPTPRRVALEWGVVPRVSEFLRIMAVHTRVESAKIVHDYTALGGLDRREQESRLLELIENGQAMDAIRLARRLFGYDVAQAKTFVEELGGRTEA